MLWCKMVKYDVDKDALNFPQLIIINNIYQQIQLFPLYKK